ncbi:hypothetical protein Sjap_002569 [Stephania japonica]|uniref:Cytochrome P450 n=1 Tax=Stephania japonica TaxID=461633 RepID=A0AAP0KNW0_9MAGN
MPSPPINARHIITPAVLSPNPLLSRSLSQFLFSLSTSIGLGMRISMSSQIFALLHASFFSIFAHHVSTFGWSSASPAHLPTNESPPCVDLTTPHSTSIALLSANQQWPRQHGPPKLPIIGNLHQLGHLPHRSLSKLSNIYGPVKLLHLGRVPLLVVSTADTAREILKTQDLYFCTRPSLLTLKRLSYNFLDVALAPYNEYWREMRRIFVQELLSTKRVHSFGAVRAEEVANTVNSISKSCSSMRPVDLTEEIFSLINRVICRIAFGSFSASDLFPSLSIVGVVDVINGLRRRLQRCFRELDKFYQEIIDEHLERAEQDEDIIDVLVGIMRDESSAIHITLNHIKAILMDIFFGGLESSSLTTVRAMTELARKPELMKKAQEEIRTSVGKKGMVEEGDLEQLHYLKIVVKETLRLHTTAPLLIPRECMNHWRRICPAMTMGILHVELALANLLYCFDWKLPSGMQIEDIDMEEETGISLHKKSPLLLVPSKYNW